MQCRRSIMLQVLYVLRNKWYLHQDFCFWPLGLYDSAFHRKWVIFHRPNKWFWRTNESTGTHSNIYLFSDWIRRISYVMMCIQWSEKEDIYKMKSLFMSTNQCCFVLSWLVWSHTKDGSIERLWKIHVFFSLLCFCSKKMDKIMWG